VLQIITVPVNADLLEIKVAAINRNRMIGSEVPLLELKHLIARFMTYRKILGYCSDQSVTAEVYSQTCKFAGTSV